MNSRDMPTTKERLAARLDWRMGAMIRRAERSWPALTLQQRRAHVEAYILLRDCLAALSGERCPQITSPWTQAEIERSTIEPLPGEWSGHGVLGVEASPLVIAVALSECEMRSTGLPPQALPARHKPVEGLPRVAHALTVDEVLHCRRGKGRRAHPAPAITPAAREREWRAKAEAKIRPR